MRNINLDLQATHAILSLLDNASTITESVIDSIPGVFLIVNQSCEILRVNCGFTTLAGVDAEACFRLPLAKFFGEKGWACFIEHLNRLAANDATIDSLAFDTPLSKDEIADETTDKSAIPFHWILTRLKVENPGEGRLFSVFGQDMSAMRFVVEQANALQNALSDLSKVIDHLQQTQDELVRSEKLAALGSMVAGIAHELNTPIGNGLMVASHLVKTSKRMSEAVKSGLRRSMLDDYLADNDSAGDVLVRNLNKAAELISSFKQVAVDQTSSQRRRFNLAEVIGEIVTALGPSIRKTPYIVEHHTPDDIFMDSYPGPLGQVLTNLINNAMLHGFDGRDAGHITIDVASCASSTQVTIAVRDDGRGIPEHVLPNVFEPFFTTKRGAGGSGLGLHIVHNIVTAVLGGRIEVESTLGAGTCFSLTLATDAPTLAASKNTSNK